MIIRILGEGQFDVPDDAVDGLNELDAQLEAAVEASDESALAPRSARCWPGARVRERGPARRLVPSDLILPHPDATSPRCVTCSAATA